MLMLENLKKRSELIASLDSALNANKYTYVIFEGKLLTNYNISKTNAGNMLSVFIDSDIALVGASHGKVMSPLFALTISENKHIAILDQYIMFSNENEPLFAKESIQNDLTMLAVAISIFYPQITQIKLPKITTDFKNDECELSSFDNDCLLDIKSGNA